MPPSRRASSWPGREFARDTVAMDRGRAPTTTAVVGAVAASSSPMDSCQGPVRLLISDTVRTLLAKRARRTRHDAQSVCMCPAGSCHWMIASVLPVWHGLRSVFFTASWQRTDIFNEKLRFRSLRILQCTYNYYIHVRISFRFSFVHCVLACSRCFDLWCLLCAVAPVTFCTSDDTRLDVLITVLHVYGCAVFNVKMEVNIGLT